MQRIFNLIYICLSDDLPVILNLIYTCQLSVLSNGGGGH